MGECAQPINEQTPRCSRRGRVAERGAITLEYVVVLCLVSLVGALAVAALGIPLLESFRLSQLLITLPVP